MSEDTKLQELIINTLSPEQMPAELSETEIYLVEDDAEYATVEELATKQDIINDLATIRDGASKGATALQSVPSEYVKNTDYATNDKGGVIRTGTYGSQLSTGGVLRCTNIQTVDDYKHRDWQTFISKGTLENIKEDLVTSIGDSKYQPIGDYATNTQLATKQDKLTAGSGIGIDNNEDAVKLFDKDKFAVIGNPTITDDGVASGFSSSNYINTPIFKPVNSRWKIKCKFKILSSFSGDVHIIGNGGSDYRLSLWAKGDDNTLHFQVGNGSAWMSAIVYSGLQLNTNYLCEIEFTGTQYKWSINGVSQTSYSSAVPISNVSNPITLGQNRYSASSHQNPFTVGSIDLSQFSIEVDGKEVFNGTKTIYQALDEKSPLIYNAQAFTKVGNPTITDNGIASGFKNQERLLVGDKVFTELETANTWEMHFTIRPSESDVSANNLSGILDMVGDGWFAPALGIDFGYLRYCISYYGTGWDILNTSLRMEANKIYNIKFCFSGDKYYLEYNNTTWEDSFIEIGTVISNIKTKCARQFILGNYGAALNRAFNGSIDLSHFSIIVDGKEVFSGALKGTQELDSFIYYQDGASGYFYNKKNGYCEQWGTATFSNDGYVTFLKTFANTNYNMIACPYGTSDSDNNWLAFPLSKETTRCKLRLIDSDGAGGKTGNVSWLAKGYLAQGQY